MPYTKREPNRLYGNRNFNFGATFQPETPSPTIEARNCTQYSADELIAAGALIDLGLLEPRQAHQDVRTSVDNDGKTTDREISLENNTAPPQSVFSSALPTSVSGSAASPPESLSDDDSDSNSITVTVKPQPVLRKTANLHNELSTTRPSYTYAPSFASDENSELFSPEAELTDSHPLSSDHLLLSQTLEDHESKHDLGDESDGSTITVKVATQPLADHEQSLAPEEDSEMSESSVVDNPSDTDFYHNNTTDEELQQVLLEEDARAEDMSDFAGSENTSDDSDFSEPATKTLAYSKYTNDDDDQASEEFAEDTPSPRSHYDADSEMTDNTDEE